MEASLMKNPNALNAYSTRKALRLINLSDKDSEDAEKIVKLFEHGNRANAKKVHEEFFRHSDTANANAMLNRFIGIINKRAKEAGIPFKCCITDEEKAEATERWVWFEELDKLATQIPSASISEEADDLSEEQPTAPNPIVNDLNGLVKKVGHIAVDQKASYGDIIEKKVVILTFNEHEKDEVINRFSPNNRNPPVYIGKDNGFNLGEHGGFRIILIHCHGQGSTVAQQYTSNAWNSWKPAAILSVGIGYGAKPLKNGEGQDIRDVLISKQVQDCNLIRVNQNGDITPHGGITYLAPYDLYNSIFNLNTKMKGKHEWPNLHFGKLLSENTLINDLNYLNELLARHNPNAIGGEMEGAGLAAVAHENSFDWILIKGISDFADGDKDHDKDKRQIEAAKNAAKVAYELLHDEDSTFHRKHFTQPESDQLMRDDKAERVDAAVLCDLIYAGEIVDALATDESMNKYDEPMYVEESSGVNILEALTVWANDNKEQPLFALLGEYGMGKTITCQRFVKHMNNTNEIPLKSGVVFRLA
jgi:nucleoside phosphorylase